MEQCFKKCWEEGYTETDIDFSGWVVVSFCQYKITAMERSNSLQYLSHYHIS